MANRKTMLDTGHLRNMAIAIDAQAISAATAAKLVNESADEIDRLNKWADSMTDSVLKERRLADATIKELSEELERTRAKLVLAADDDIMRQESALSATAPSGSANSALPPRSDK